MFRRGLHKPPCALSPEPALFHRDDRHTKLKSIKHVRSVWKGSSHCEHKEKGLQTSCALAATDSGPECARVNKDDFTVLVSVGATE